MTQQIIAAFILGLVGGIIPGPVLAAIFTEILQSGFYKSMRIILWAMLTETIVALVALLVLSSFGFSATFFNALSFIGAGILIWISTSLWKIKSLDTDQKVYFSPWKIALMILANGVLWTYWITVCIPKAIELGQQLQYGQFLFLLFVEIGWFLATAGVALVFSRFRTILSNPRVIPFIFKFFALIFLYFAASMIYHSVIFFLSI